MHETQIVVAPANATTRRGSVSVPDVPTSLAQLAGKQVFLVFRGVFPPVKRPLFPFTESHQPIRGFGSSRNISRFQTTTSSESPSIPQLQVSIYPRGIRSAVRVYKSRPEPE
jgi:hypothetical protein